MDSEDEEVVSDLSGSETGWSDDEVPIDTGEDNLGSSFFMDELLSEAVEPLGNTINYKPDNLHLELIFDIGTMPVCDRQALGLADIDQIIIELIFYSNRFGAGSTPRSELRYVKSHLPAPEHSAQPFTEPVTTEPEPAGASLSPDGDGEQVAPASPHSSDSDSDDEPAHIPKKYKRPVVTTVAYQFANIAKKKLADDWPETQHATWKQAKGWIAQLHSYRATRLTKLGDYCVICDDLQPVSGIKPVACSKNLCSHQFDEMGFGASMDIIYNFPTVADLLISMAAAAAGNPNMKHRQRFFACPNPPSDFVCELFKRDQATDPDNWMGIQWTELQTVLADLPAVAKMAAAKDLQAFLNKYHRYAYRLVRWILSTCRGHITELSLTEQIHGMGGHQFKLFTNTFERELAFQKLKEQQQGSFYVFHGSPFLKWHSIMRTCLQTFSNTQYMTAGAAYGAGVYTAKHASTSLGYCTARHPTYSPGGSYSGYKASIFGESASCLALVEVAGQPSPGHSGGIHVVKNHDGVVARYFFVYSSSAELPTQMNTDNMQIPAWDA